MRVIAEAAAARGILQKSTAAENENRDADLAQIASMVDFLCILADVPIEDEAADKEGMSHE